MTRAPADPTSLPDPIADDRSGVTPEAIAARLLTLLAELGAELHPGRVRPGGVSLDSTLEQDLGLDSLGRAELLARIERSFAVTLPDRLLVSAETGRDLARSILAARVRPGAGAAPAPVVASPDAGSPPDHAETLVEALAWHAAHHPERTHIVLHEEEGSEEISYRQLHAGAGSIARGLSDLGVEPGQAVAIMLPTGRDYFHSFFGALLAGAIPLPVYPPVRPSQLEAHLRRHGRMLANALTAVLITVPEAKALARVLQASVPTLGRVLTADELRAGEPAPARYRPAARDTALLQYTSGSTGDPKGVVLTHADLLANLRVMGRAIGMNSTDVFVSWLPLYHDMGLIGAWLGCLYYGAPLVVMSPVAFLRRPRRWLTAIDRHRGTLSAAPNFAYEMCVHKIDEDDLAGIDLSCWRLAFNGAEPISPDAMRAFSERFAPYGFRPETMAPVYGLAECTLGLAFPPLGRPPVVDRVAAEPFTRSGHARPARDPAAASLRFVACGRPLPGYQVRVVDPGGHELPERREGRLEFCGPSTTSGYFRNPEATARLFHGAWLDSGDLGYMADGDVYVTRRAKDVIIRAGRNLLPYELEEAAGAVAGIRKGCVAVFASPDPRSGTERVVVLAEVRDTDPAVLSRIRAEVLAIADESLGIPVDEVVLAPPYTVLKTSSGKIRRAACRELFERGRVGEGPRPVWLQLARLLLSGIPGHLRRLTGIGIAHAYAGYAWLMGGAVALLAFPLIVLTPRWSWRWRLARLAARTMIGLSGSSIRVEGLANLAPRAPCVLVANHASYIDGFVLAAALPAGFCFVAKAELGQSPGIGLLLRRLGTQFVDRFDRQRSVADARRIARDAEAGRSLLFFPEGTLRRMTGIMPFRMGAFLAAAEAGRAVVPVALSGTRSILRSESWFPRRGAIRVAITPPIVPEGSDWEAAIKLRDAARARIVGKSGEPELEYVPEVV